MTFPNLQFFNDYLHKLNEKIHKYILKKYIKKYIIFKIKPDN